MIPATLLALVAAAAPVQAPTARVFLKAPAAAAPRCKTTPVDKSLVRAGLFAPESEKCPVAVVGDEAIFLGELARTLEEQHLSRPGGGGPHGASGPHGAPAPMPAARKDMDFSPALDRIIGARLIVQEAREMRLDQDPAFRREVESFEASRLRALLQKLAVKGVQPDPAVVERHYREAVREWKLKSILVKKEDAAKAFKAGLDAKKDFDALAKPLLDAKQAEGAGPAEFVSPNHMLPEVAAALGGAKAGVAIGPVQVPNGWVILRPETARYPANDAKARAEARTAALSVAQRDTIRKFYVSLVAKYAKVDQKLLESLDFEANGEKGFVAMMEDERPVVTIAGDAPITVGDLAREVSMKFFHGLEGPIKEKRVNKEKDEAFEKLLGARVFAKEAAVRKLASRPELRAEVEEYERGLAFNTFVEKVIAPDVKVSEADAMGWYEAHKAELTTPTMYRLDGFAFATVKEAQAALDKLKGGTDYPWLRQTAPGQLPPEQRSIQLEGHVLSASAMPRALANALTGAKTGDYRLYPAREKEVWVVRVVELKPPQTQPYQEAREKIAKQLWNERLGVAIGDYAAKLRKAVPVQVLITRVAP